MGLLGSIAGIFGALKKKKAISQASTAQQQALQGGINTLQTTTGQGQIAVNNAADAGRSALLGQQDVTRGDLASTLAGYQPYLTAGTSALGAQGDLLGLNGNDQQSAAIASLRNSPLFQSLFRAGNDTILQDASATGGLRGGNVQSSLANFGSDTLSRVIEDQLSRLGGVAGQGLSAASSGAQARLGADQIGSGLAGGIANLDVGQGSQIAQLLQSLGINVANLQGAQGQAKAGGILGKAQASQELYGNIASGIGQTIAAVSGIPGGGQLSQAAQFAGKFL